jgi:hypothetical protein
MTDQEALSIISIMHAFDATKRAKKFNFLKVILI